MVVFIIFGVLMLVLVGWLVIKQRRAAGDVSTHDVTAAARRARGDADRFGTGGGGAGGDGMNG
jgi:hypothetical protein